MNLRTLVILTLVSLSAVAERSAGGFAIDPFPTVPTTVPATTPADTTTTSNTEEPSSDTNTPTSVLPSGTSNTESVTTGLPSITIPSASSQSASASSTSSQQPASQQEPTQVVTITTSSSGISSFSSPSSLSSGIPNNSGSGNSSTISTGTIVGLSVAGGIAVFGAVAFLIWKFTRKRFSEFDANGGNVFCFTGSSNFSLGEEIRWPELGHESHALPTRPTGRVGVDDDGYDEAGIDGAGRRLGNYAPSSTGETSMADLHSYNDPYAVPPLPHLDPNQPYRDDPANYGGHYDPYQGPVPQSFHDPSNVDRISKLKLYFLIEMLKDDTDSRSPVPGNYGRRSPGPSLPYSRTGF